jgi:hypothetical protein
VCKFVNAREDGFSLIDTTGDPMRSLLTIASVLLMGVLLGWQALHGGVPSHHFLARPDLPAVSNAWSLLVLPLLSWFLLGRVERRLEEGAAMAPVLAGFGGALLFGVVLAWCVDAGHGDVCNLMVMALAPVALFYPLHRAECILGFVLGMTLFIGAILPTIAGFIFAAMGAVLYYGVRLLWATVAAVRAR